MSSDRHCRTTLPIPPAFDDDVWDLNDDRTADPKERLRIAMARQ